MPDAEAASLEAGGGRHLARRALDTLAVLGTLLLLWRLVAGPELWIGSFKFASIKQWERGVWGLAAVLLLRHLIFGPGGPLDRPLSALAGRWTAGSDRMLAGVDPGMLGGVQWIPCGLLLWGLLGGVSGATAGMVHLLTRVNLDLAPGRALAAVWDPAVREALWGLLSAMLPAVAVSWWMKRRGGGDTLAHLLFLDGFLIVGPLGPWARAHRFELSPAVRVLPAPVIGALTAIALGAVAAWIVPAVAAGGWRRMRTVAVLVLFTMTAGALLFAGNSTARLLDGTRPAFRASRPALPPGAPSRVLLITIDTLRADHLGCYGYERPTSPNIDRLAASGTRFERAYCAMPLTDPSHTSILTGWFPRAHGLLRNGGSVHSDLEPIPSIAETMLEAGYDTAAITSRQHLHPGELGIRGFRFLSVPFSEEMVPAADTLARALDWLEVHGDEPFFLWVHFFDPHFPYTPPDEIARRFVADYNGTIDRGNNYTGTKYTDAEVPYMVGLYDAEIATADEAVGRLVGAVQGLATDGNVPLMVLTADHGESLGELKASEDYVFAHGEYLTESQIHIPLIISRPGTIPGGRVNASVVGNFSVAPTIAELAGLSGPGATAPWQAPSLARLLGPVELPPAGEAGSADEVFVQRRYYQEPPRPFHRVEEDAIVTTAWKLITNVVRGSRLFDLAADPTELLNRAPEEGMRVTDLSRRLEAWKARYPIPKEAFGVISEEKMDQLRALGYIQ